MTLPPRNNNYNSDNIHHHHRSSRIVDIDIDDDDEGSTSSRCCCMNPKSSNCTAISVQTACHTTTTSSSKHIAFLGGILKYPWFISVGMKCVLLLLLMMMMIVGIVVVSGSTISSTTLDSTRRNFPSSSSSSSSLQQQQQQPLRRSWLQQQKYCTSSLHNNNNNKDNTSTDKGAHITTAFSSSSSSASTVVVDASTTTQTTPIDEGGGGTSSSMNLMDNSSISSKSRNNNNNSNNNNSNNNMIISLLLYIKDSTIRTTQSCTQLYKNHQRCNMIRQKQSLYRNRIKEQYETIHSNNNISNNDNNNNVVWTKELKQLLQNVNGGITYEEYIFLINGKEDRGKVMNLAFLMYGAPKVLPYALMFNKNMLPSTFTTTTTSSTTSPTSNNDAQQQQQQYYTSTIKQYERRQALMNTLYNIEKQFLTLLMGEMTNGSNNNNNFMTNLFTKKSSSSKSNPKLQQKYILHNVITEMSDLFRYNNKWNSCSTPSSTVSKSVSVVVPVSMSTMGKTAYNILQKYESILYRTNGIEFTGLEQRLGHIPSCIVQGIANALLYNGIPNSITQITPKVLHRRKYIGHLEKITKEDDFLINNMIDISTIPLPLLINACHDRMIHVSPTISNGNNDNNNHAADLQELRQSLMEWLQLTRNKYGSQQSQLFVVPPPFSRNSDSGIITSPPMLETASVVHLHYHHNNNNNVVQAASVKSTNGSTKYPITKVIPASTSATTTIIDNSDASSKIYYNGNLARMILMAYYGYTSICRNNVANEESSPLMIGHLPQLLYSSNSK